MKKELLFSDTLSKTLQYYDARSVDGKDKLPDGILAILREQDQDIVFAAKQQALAGRPNVVARLLQEPEFSGITTSRKAKMLQESFLFEAALIVSSEWANEQSTKISEARQQIASALHAMYC